MIYLWYDIEYSIYRKTYLLTRVLNRTLYRVIMLPPGGLVYYTYIAQCAKRLRSPTALATAAWREERIVVRGSMACSTKRSTSWSLAICVYIYIYIYVYIDTYMAMSVLLSGCFLFTGTFPTLCVMCLSPYAGRGHDIGMGPWLGPDLGPWRPWASWGMQAHCWAALHIGPQGKM